MYAEILNGVKMEKSRFAKDAESKALWKQISNEIAAIRKQNPKAQFDVPSEIPES